MVVCRHVIGSCWACGVFFGLGGVTGLEGGPPSSMVMMTMTRTWLHKATPAYTVRGATLLPCSWIPTQHKWANEPDSCIVYHLSRCHRGNICVNSLLPVKAAIRLCVVGGGGCPWIAVHPSVGSFPRRWSLHGSIWTLPHSTRDPKFLLSQRKARAYWC